MNLEGKNIEAYFISLDYSKIREHFPAGVDYITQYKNNAAKICATILPSVEKGAMIHNGGCLNNYGVKHINTVIRRVTSLVESNGLELSFYEIYVLLMAIHLHDIGNITGREDHEQKIFDISETVANIDYKDAVEQDCIIDIAESHGGDYSNIAELNVEEMVLGIPVNKKKIGSLLRLADEISDDYDRADEALLKSGKLPDYSVIFHLFSYSLKTVKFDNAGKSILNHFRINESDLKSKLKKPKKDGSIIEIYFIEEIYERTMKTFREAIFCSKYLCPHIMIDKVRVAIEIVLEEKDSHNRVKKKFINYDIHDNGYILLDFGNLCPDIASLTGEKLAEQLINKTFEDVNPRTK